MQSINFKFWATAEPFLSPLAGSKGGTYEETKHAPSTPPISLIACGLNYSEQPGLLPQTR